MGADDVAAEVITGEDVASAFDIGVEELSEHLRLVVAGDWKTSGDPVDRAVVLLDEIG